MLETLFGWRKASRCKELIRRVRFRLKLLRNKRDAIVRQSKHDVAQLLRNGQNQSAFARVEQLFKDQSMLAAFKLLDHFCEFVILQLPYMRKHRDCPNDINEAVSSLIFAAARCSDLPELQMLRTLFGERYGHKFVVDAVELFPSSLVNRQLTEKLCINSISEEAKVRLIEEIAKESSLQLGSPEIEDDWKLPSQQVYGLHNENDFDWEEGVSERDIQVISSSRTVAQFRELNVAETLNPCEQKHMEYTSAMQKDTRSHGTLWKWKRLVVNPCQPLAVDLTSDSIIIVPARCRTPDQVEPPMKSALLHRNTDELKYGRSDPPPLDSGQRCVPVAPMQPKVERTSTETLSERSTKFPERVVLHPDDLDDFYPSMGDDSEGKDERVAMVKSKDLPQWEKSVPSNIGLEIVRSLDEEEQVNGNGREGVKSLQNNRASLSDIRHDDCAINHTNFNELQDGRGRTGQHSSKRKKPGRQRSYKGSTPEHGVYHRESTANCGEFGDFLNMTSSWSRKSETGEGYSSISMAVGMKEAEYALYYEELDDIDYSGHKWKTKDSVVKPNREASGRGSHHRSTLNSKEDVGVRSERPFLNGSNHRKRRQQPQDILSDGSRTSSFMGKSPSHWQPCSCEQDNCQCVTQAEFYSELLESHNPTRSCKYNKGRRSASSCRLIPDASEDHSLKHPGNVEASWAKSASSEGQMRSMVVSTWSYFDSEGESCCSPLEGAPNYSLIHNKNIDKDRWANRHAFNITEPELVRVSFPLKQYIDPKMVGPDLNYGTGGSSDIATQIHRPNHCCRDNNNNNNNKNDDDDDDEKKQDSNCCYSNAATRGSCFPGQVKFGSESRPCKPTSSIPRSPMAPPYQRAMTMPPERPRCSPPTKQTMRSASLQRPSHSRGTTHVHPKLPDYDDLASKFAVLKNEHRQSMARTSNA